MKYQTGDKIETKYFYNNAHKENQYKVGVITKIESLTNGNYIYYIDFNEGFYNPKRIGGKLVEKFSRKYEPKIEKRKKFKFLF